MTPLFPARRAAEEFDQVLSGEASAAANDRYADLLETVGVLRTQLEVLPRADFVGDLRSRLMTAAETELVAAPSVARTLTSRRTSRTNRRLGTVAACLVIVGGTAGMAAAASGALPGESLYPIKRGVERAEAAVRVGDGGKGKELLEQSAVRLEEVRALQAQGSPEAEMVATTLESFRTSAGSGSARLFTAYRSSGDTENITTVRSFAARQMAGIAALSGTSAVTDAELVDAADTLADIDQHARVLCGTCGPAAPLDPPEVLSAGAGAATVENLLARPVSQAHIDSDNAEAARVAAGVAALKSAAEKSAGKIPQAGDPTGVAAGGVPSLGSVDHPLRSTITRDGGLVPATSSGVAVKDLVSGVTGTVPGATSKATGGQTPLDDTVKKIGDPVGKATDDLLP